MRGAPGGPGRTTQGCLPTSRLLEPVGEGVEDGMAREPEEEEAAGAAALAAGVAARSDEIGARRRLPL